MRRWPLTGALVVARSRAFDLLDVVGPSVGRGRWRARSHRDGAIVEIRGCDVTRILIYPTPPSGSGRKKRHAALDVRNALRILGA